MTPSGRAGAVILLSHGSLDPRSEPALEVLAQKVTRALDGPRVEIAHLDHRAPRLSQAVDVVWRSGVSRAAVVPLLLSTAFHAHVDVPRAVAQARLARPGVELVLTPPLGADAQLLRGADELLAGIGVQPGDGTGVVLASAGSSHDDARALLARLARAWRGHGWPGTAAAFATGPGPTIAQAVTTVRDNGCPRVAVVPFVLAPGSMGDRVAEQSAAVGALVAPAALFGTRAVVDLVVSRARAHHTHPSPTAE